MKDNGGAHQSLSYRKSGKLLVLTSVQKRNHVKPILFLAKELPNDVILL